MTWIPRLSWTWLEVSRKCFWKWLEMSDMVWNDCKWMGCLENSENGWTQMKLAGNVWKWLELPISIEMTGLAENGWNGQKWLDIAWHGWKYLELAGNGGTYQKWLERAWNDWKWPSWPSSANWAISSQLPANYQPITKSQYIIQLASWIMY